MSVLRSISKCALRSPSNRLRWLPTTEYVTCIEHKNKCARHPLRLDDRMKFVQQQPHSRTNYGIGNVFDLAQNYSHLFTTSINQDELSVFAFLHSIKKTTTKICLGCDPASRSGLSPVFEVQIVYVVGTARLDRIYWDACGDCIDARAAELFDQETQLFIVYCACVVHLLSQTSQSIAGGEQLEE